MNIVFNMEELNIKVIKEYSNMNIKFVSLSSSSCERYWKLWNISRLPDIELVRCAQLVFGCGTESKLGNCLNKEPVVLICNFIAPNFEVQQQNPFLK